ncbi:unnamed protein product [Cladocopium goreaui]|uniref:Histone-lysine N-methyltransferase SMYD3 (SET an d MYND domain-containing protein 3) (Zinc finger MYND domain-containing protein 1) n=1 Tax=Cladocopium goreaui TaxID=2562237 RepID=A0A9P1CHK2_9DINO|nr:unnamed protein product [Cladocopium goreaui]
MDTMEPPPYDFKQLLTLRPGDSAGVEDFVGPIDVAWVPGKGRGILVQRDVPQGELLFACKAMAVAETPKLVEVTCQKLRNCGREDFDAFFLLCTRRATPNDLPQLRHGKGGGVTVIPRMERKEVKREEVQAILSANAHELDTSDLCCQKPGKTVSGIFLLASLVNHSCQPSAARIFLGDMMFVRAARHMRAGDEVTDGYVSVVQPATERRKAIRERYGFDLTGDRILLEEQLFSEAVVQQILDRIDDSAAVEDFIQILDDVGDLVASQLRRLSSASVAVRAAAKAMGCGVERVLLGGLVLAVQVAVATILSDLKRHHEAAAAYCRCCWFMEELAPHNAYHAKWAVEALLSASRGGVALEGYAGYARKVLEGHCGPGALEVALGASKAIQGMEDATRTCPPGEVEVTCRVGKDLTVQLELPGPLSAQDLELAVSSQLLDLSLPIQFGGFGLLPRCRGLLLVLPKEIDPDSGTVRLSQGGRRLKATFKVIN